jgi:hypothetical protein
MFSKDGIGSLGDRTEAEARLDGYLSTHEVGFPLNKEGVLALLGEVVAS